jgi:hypothetical protein
MADRAMVKAPQPLQTATGLGVAMVMRKCIGFLMASLNTALAKLRCPGHCDAPNPCRSASAKHSTRCQRSQSLIGLHP